MIRPFLRPNLIKQFNIRKKCDLKCKERCIDLTSKQTESLYKICNYTEKMLFISIINLMGPIIIVGSVSISSFINHLLH